MFDPTIPQTLQALITRELDSGERIVWIGTPRKAFFTPLSIGAVLFGIPWTAFALFWTFSAVSMGGGMGKAAGISSLFALFGLPFVLVGIAMLTSPIWTYWKASKTIYAITDRRAITIDGGWANVVKSYLPHQLTEIVRREKSDGSGDLILSRREYRDSDGDRRREELGFFRIEKVKDVERKLRDLAKPSEPNGTFTEN